MAAKHFNKKQILAAQAVTKSNKGAARYLGCSFQHYRKYAKAYGLYESHKNPTAVGIPKFKMGRIDRFSMKDIVEGRLDASHFDAAKLKYRMIEAGYLKNECYMCGFKEARIVDGKVPLILNFKDKNPRHWNNGNAELLCYNHYFVMVGNIFNKKDIESMETIKTPKKTSKALDLELDEYTKKRLQELGL